MIPLTIRRRNGRPGILPPDNVAEKRTLTQYPHIMKALGRAWAWRRLESGEAATIHYIAKTAEFTDRYVSRMMRLAYLSSEVLERLVVWQDPLSVSLNELIAATYLPWSEHARRVF